MNFNKDPCAKKKFHICEEQFPSCKIQKPCFTLQRLYVTLLSKNNFVMKPVIFWVFRVYYQVDVQLYRVEEFSTIFKDCRNWTFINDVQTKFYILDHISSRVHLFNRLMTWRALFGITIQLFCSEYAYTAYLVVIYIIKSTSHPI